METSLYFLFGDLLATGLAGAVCGLASAAVVVPGWNMFLAMIPAMVVGMAVSQPISIGFGALFRASQRPSLPEFRSRSGHLRTSPLLT